LTHLHDVTPEQALAVLLHNAKLQEAPTSRRPLSLEAVIGIGKDNHAIVAIQPEDLEALNSILSQDASCELPVATEHVEQTDGQTVRTDLKDGKVVALESYRPIPGADGDSAEDRRDYALRELDPFLQLAQEGKIRALVVAAELVDERSSITYPVGQWEPGLIAAVELLKTRLVAQG